MSEYFVIDSVWFTARDSTIGAVAIRTTRGWKAYISSVAGHSEELDSQYVARWGAKLPKEIAVAMFPKLLANEYVS